MALQERVNRSFGRLRQRTLQKKLTLSHLQSLWQVEMRKRYGSWRGGWSGAEIGMMKKMLKDYGDDIIKMIHIAFPRSPDLTVYQFYERRNEFYLASQEKVETVALNKELLARLPRSFRGENSEN